MNQTTAVFQSGARHVLRNRLIKKAEPEIKSYFHNFNQLWPILKSQFSLNPPPIPGSIPNEYGGNALFSYWKQKQNEALRPAYNFAAGLDNENRRRNISTILQRSLATLGMKPNQNQAKSIERIADGISTYVPVGLNVLSRLLGNRSIPFITSLQKGFDYLNGPRGSIMPMYEQMKKQIGGMPINQQNDFMIGYLKGLDSDKDSTAGFNYSDSAKIHDYAYSRGRNPFILK